MQAIYKKISVFKIKKQAQIRNYRDKQGDSAWCRAVGVCNPMRQIVVEKGCPNQQYKEKPAAFVVKIPRKQGDEQQFSVMIWRQRLHDAFYVGQAIRFALAVAH